MSLTFILRLNAIVCAVFGWMLAVFTVDANQLLGNQYPAILAPVGIALIIYAYWLWHASKRDTPNLTELKIFIAGDYAWSALMLVLISTGLVIVESMGIRIAMVTALFTAAMGALQFRHFKQLMNKF